MKTREALMAAKKILCNSRPNKNLYGDVIEIGDSSIAILSADATDEEDDLSDFSMSSLQKIFSA